MSGALLVACALTLGLHVAPWASSTRPRFPPLRLSAAGDPAELRESAAIAREAALAQREQALREREEAVALRERAASKRENALRAREGFGLSSNSSRPDLNAVAAKIEARVTRARRRGTTRAEFDQAVADGVGYKWFHNILLSSYNGAVCLWERDKPRPSK